MTVLARLGQDVEVTVRVQPRREGGDIEVRVLAEVFALTRILNL
jgi:hypothetical protein